MMEKLREAIDKLIEMEWITLKKNITKEAIVVVIKGFIEDMSLVAFARWIKNL